MEAYKEPMHKRIYVDICDEVMSWPSTKMREKIIPVLARLDAQLGTQRFRLLNDKMEKMEDTFSAIRRGIIDGQNFL